jgi:hypothetical protein
MRDGSPYSSRSHPARWRWLIAGVAVVLTAALAFALTEPLPPRRVVMATGTEGGAYAAVGQRYRAIFARHGIRLELLATRGSVDNVERLRDPRAGVSVALVQSGVTSAVKAPELASLGTLFYEEAASEIHATPDVFGKVGQFPAAEPIDLPLSRVARQYYRSGQPFLQRYLPFWMAAWASRLLVLLIPVVGILYPMFRVLPALYGWGMRRRIFRLYGELKFLEAELASGATGGSTSAVAERLDQLEQRADRLHVPVAFAHMLYTLKVHIGLVRQRVRAAQDGG